LSLQHTFAYCQKRSPLLDNTAQTNATAHILCLFRWYNYITWRICRLH